MKLSAIRSAAFAVALSPAPAALAEGLTTEVLAEMDACLEVSATERDVANTTVTCFNQARVACGADVLSCEAEMTTALAERAAGLRERLPDELEGVQDFAKERYQEILTDIETGAADLCAGVADAERVSCDYRAEALRFAKLRSVGSQLDPRFLIP